MSYIEDYIKESMFKLNEASNILNDIRSSGDDHEEAIDYVKSIKMSPNSKIFIYNYNSSIEVDIEDQGKEVSITSIKPIYKYLGSTVSVVGDYLFSSHRINIKSDLLATVKASDFWIN